MLLTLSSSAKSEFDYKNPHDFSPQLSTKKHSSLVNGESAHQLPAKAPHAMGTPHRGLPPPSAMTLPDPSRAPPPVSQSLGQMPAPPQQWQGAEESMRNWLAAKAEEDKRKQEEEKTRQESLRLEQRKIEQTMLRESMQGGIPPHLVPMIFAGIGAGNLSSISVEWLQQYAAQMQVAQQQQQQQAQVTAPLSPELRRERGMINPLVPTMYGVAPPAAQSVLPSAPILPGQPVSGPQQPPYGQAAAGTMSPTSRSRAAQPASQVAAPTSAPRPPQHSQLPRLTTNEMQVQQPPSAAPTASHLQSTQQEPASSPSIYFHHWVPPTSQAGSSGNPPATPSDYTSSPKKRKAQGPHPPPPIPTSVPQYTSPSFSHASSSHSTPGRRTHGRTRSNTSTGAYEAQSRPMSRHTPASGSGGGDHGGDGGGGSHRPPASHRETRRSQQMQFSTMMERGSAGPSSPKREASR